MTFTPEELAYLASQRLGRLATMAPGGDLQNSPVSFHVNADGTIDIPGRRMGASRKFRNVQTHPQVAFVVDDIASVTPWVVRCLEIRGEAEALTDVDPPAPYFSREVIRIRPRRVISFGIADGAAAAARNVG
ncbi:PPOX class F420-dependent oxidoreductase [Oryzihumus sp.]